MRPILLLLCLVQAPGITELAPEGDFVEPLSRIAFSRRIGDWSRTQVLKYPPPPPSNHSVTFELRPSGDQVYSRATVYVFSADPALPSNLEEHFAITLDELAVSRSDFELVSEGPMDLDSAHGSIPGRVATFILRGGFGDYPRPVICQLLLLQLEGYWVKWRITSPTDERRNVPEQIMRLVIELLPAE